ncbi:hypothetical protein AUC45_06375 [Erythrobacter sp. YT30]|nr:hypothetical protein AUC45_06375 [Erythrobacter sp. YT30]
MSVFNGEAYLADAIQSVLDQTYTNFEFILINDGSSDGSLAIIEDFAGRDPRIRVIDQANTGLTVALRTGCEAARGKYIARMDADDFSMPERLEKQVYLLESDPDLVAATGDVEHFFDDGTISHVSRLRLNPKLLRLYICFGNRIGGHGQVMFRRDAYEKAGGYDTTFRMAQDYDLWARLLRLGDFGIVREIIYRFRTGHDSISKRSKSEQASHSLRTCRREYARVTGQQITEEIALGLRYFWWNMPGTATNQRDTSAVSKTMDRAVTAFFQQNPQLAHEEYEVRRNIAARWWWRAKGVPPSHLDYHAIFAANIAKWGTSALIAKATARG